MPCQAMQAVKLKVNAGTLILEVTRRCNQQCAHCLRGHCQAMDMTKETIDAVLDSMESIGSVVFTGGEPTLNLPIIQYFFEEANRHGKLPSCFWLATNGLEHQIELAKILLDWYPLMEEQSLCGVTISVDQFHKKPAVNYLAGLAFYTKEKEHPNGMDNRQIIHSGLAEENGLGFHSAHEDLDFEVSMDDDTIDVDFVYVSANGLITGDCDMSYEAIDEVGISLESLCDPEFMSQF